MDMIPLQIETFIVYFVFTSALILGIIWGGTIPLINIKNSVQINPKSLLRSLLIISSSCIIIGWCLIIKHYGSLFYIITHSFDIRNETIGDGLQIIPTFISYLSSFCYVGFPISLAMYYSYKEKVFIGYAFAFFFVIILGDLQAFGRIGILFAIFILVSYYIECIHKLPSLKTVLSVFILLVILMLPRYLRGGNSLENVGSRYRPFLLIDVSPFFESFLSVYAYYFSGIFALNNLLFTDIDYQGGQRNFSALINLLNRIIPLNDNRITIIADFTYIPYDTNIYSIIGEMWMDGGLLFIIIFSILFGSIIGWLYKYNGSFALALKFILITWILETPIYNVFSFGNFLLAFLFVSYITIFCNDSKYHNSKLQLRRIPD